MLKMLDDVETTNKKMMRFMDSQNFNKAKQYEQSLMEVLQRRQFKEAQKHNQQVKYPVILCDGNKQTPREVLQPLCPQKLSAQSLSCDKLVSKSEHKTRNP